MAELIKIYWRDIPSQVTAKAGRKTAKVMLPARFQEGIDRDAAAELIEQFDEVYLEAVVKAKGVAENAKLDR